MQENTIIWINGDYSYLSVGEDIIKRSGFIVDSFTDPVGAFKIISESTEKYIAIISGFRFKDSIWNGVELMMNLKKEKYFGIARRAIYTFDFEDLADILSFFYDNLYKEITLLDKNLKDGKKVGHELSEYLKTISK